jgi:hypothetical protein
MPYWEYLRWGVYVSVAFGAWRLLPLAIVRLVAAFTRNEARHKQCMEVLRLARRDAPSIPSYISASPPGRTKRARVEASPGQIS